MGLLGFKVSDLLTQATVSGQPTPSASVATVELGFKRIPTPEGGAKQQKTLLLVKVRWDVP